MIQCPDCQQPFNLEIDMINHSLMCHEQTHYPDIPLTVPHVIVSSWIWRKPKKIEEENHANT